MGMVVAVTAAAIGIIYGYDVGAISGALLFIPHAFGLSTQGTSSLATSLSVGLLVGVLAGGWIANAIGRKRTLLIVASSFCVFAILSGAAQNLLWLDIVRFLLGTSIGISSATAPLFIAECAPAAKRGALLLSYQIAYSVGVVIAYFVDYALAQSADWRLMLGISAIPAAAVAVAVYRLPDTPRWYMLKGRRAEALATLAAVDPGADPDEELALIAEDVSPVRGSLRQLLRKPYRRAALFAIGYGLCVKITGSTAITFYGPLIYKSLGLHGYFVILIIPALTSILGLAATLTSARLIDRIGRRPLLLTGMGIMMAGYGLLALGYALGHRDEVLTLATAGFALFYVGTGLGLNAMIWCYASESFPGRFRAAGASITLTADEAAGLIITQYFLTWMGVLGGRDTFLLFLGICILAVLFLWRYAPETKGRPLETLHEYWENGAQWPDAVPQAVGTASGQALPPR
jgi:MFS transporter, SP family, arabinose:H+ symporter